MYKLVYLLMAIGQSLGKERSEGLVIFPEGSRQVVRQGANLTITCTYDYQDDAGQKLNDITWILPDALAKNNPLSQGVNDRLRNTFDRNHTHMTSTLTLENLRTKDTGYFTCNVHSALHYESYRQKQYVYVYSDADYVIIDDNAYQEYSSKQGDSIQIPCRPTHPNVTFHLIRNSQITAKGYIWERSENLLSDPDSKWNLDPERGLSLKDTTISDTGQYQCVGTMNNVSDWEYFQIYVKGIELVRIGDADDPLEGSNITLICRTHVQREFASPPEWAYQLIDVTGETLKVINGTNTDEESPINAGYYDDLDSHHQSSKAAFYSRERTWRYYESRQELIDVALNTNITFQCKANKDKEIMFKKISFRVKEINNEPVLNFIHLDKARPKNLTCVISLQRNKMLWFKDDKEYPGRVHSSGNVSILPLNGIVNEIGVYSCRWNNSLGQSRFRNFTVFLGNSNGLTNATAIPLSANLVALIVIIGIGIKLYLDKKRQVFPKAKKLLEGNVNPPVSQQLSMEDQIEALPYDKRWEFPKHRLTLGIQLGAGCFGRVVKAEAVGIEGSGEHAKTVAVKMVRSQTNVAALEALVSEMKILMHLASHLNVVNLLGACTKDIDKGELLLIVEYCRFGNLQAYLINHRENFINLMDDFGNMKSDNEADQIVSVCNGNVEGTRLQLKPKKPPDTIKNGTEMTQQMAPPLELIYDPQEPKSFWHYQQDPDATLIRSVSTRDLISWSFQIARGMDYLASKKVLHGDLAARNVLLADDGVVKVADFGMARKMYLEGNYEKKGQGLMPIRWMAIESLTDRIFSSQSDVWSYGILLWELFSLGKVPYPGMEVGSQLLKEIQSGYRMEKPEYATNTMSKVMTDCWKTDPKERPTFRQLQEMIHDHIESSVSSDYWSLNFPYAKLSEEKRQSSCTAESSGLAKQFSDNIFKKKSRALSLPAEDA
ncbi:vascular endothelial growth factor receptor 1-like isoform X2 [Daphnia pulex]|uniref:vascular endothelial growth factor receptor 1-like isoform X2 n=1 Tax=Daphnia pulex TaxID=6669 RepID=UPI001EDEAFF3|nr:vascular endothelial growth factor receptor 1-like isoform X2 [Daphnia pulex]